MSDPASYAQDIFIGTAKVRFPALKFPLPPHSGHRFVDKRNVKRLVNIFKLEGCLNADPLNRISGFLCPNFGGLQDLKQHSTEFEIPLIELPPSSVECLYGHHRILAAREVLPIVDQWWIVDLYLSGQASSDRIRIHLESEYANSLNISDGEIYRNIRLQIKAKNTKEERRWWARLSTSKRRDAKTLMGRSNLCQAFDCLLHLSGLWAGLQLGVFQRILSLNCDEEIVTYLCKIRQVWEHFLLASHEYMALLDSTSVKLLELKAPGIVAEDNLFVENGMRNGKILSFIKDASSRRLIKAVISGYRGIIPSLRTLFEDTKYLEVCARGMRLLVPPSTHRSLKDSFAAAFQSPGKPAVLQVDADQFLRIELAPGRDKFLYAYQQLWLFNMRHFPDLSNTSPRKEKQHPKPSIKSKNNMVIHSMKQVAAALGFHNEIIADVQENDPFLQCVQELLQEIWPQDTSGTNIELEQQLVHLLKQHHPVPTKPQVRKTGVEDLMRRCGRPYELSHNYDRHFLFDPDYFLSSHGDVLSSLEVSKHFFRSFFSSADTESHGREGIGSPFNGDTLRPESPPSLYDDPEVIHRNVQTSDELPVSEAEISTDIVDYYQAFRGSEDLQTTVFLWQADTQSFQIYCTVRHMDLWTVVSETIGGNNDMVALDGQMRSLQTMINQTPEWCDSGNIPEKIYIGKSCDINKILNAMK
ncbi:hypothetical protein TWF103_011391 [Orbilia oligospora]|nr:hypothetical protein TWF103_011391 [Orbilia oligospora]